MAHLLHAHLRSLIAKKNTKSRTFWMPDNMDKVVNSNTSYTGRVIHTLTTHGLITRTYMRLTFSKNFILPTPLWLDKLKYKKVPVFSPIDPHPPLSFVATTTRKISPLLLSLHNQHVSFLFSDFCLFTLHLSRTCLPGRRQHSISLSIPYSICRRHSHSPHEHSHFYPRFNPHLCSGLRRCHQ